MTQNSERSAQRFFLIINYATHEPYDSNEPEIPSRKLWRQYKIIDTAFLHLKKMHDRHFLKEENN